jgi:Flp pilus assembly protein TadD
MRRYRLEIAVCVALLALTAGAMGVGCWNGFANYDDNDYVTENRMVKAGLSWSGARWAFTSTHAANWHPLTWLSLELDASLYGPESAWGYHITNLLLHAANVVLLFLALRRLTGAVWRSAAVAALFAVHPAHVESVAWISERKDVLSGLFWMLTMLAYAWYAERPNWRRYLAVAAPFALGLMAKPMVVTLPCVLLLLDYWPLGRLKSEIRNPKSETNPKPEIPRTQTGRGRVWNFGFGFWNLFRISGFGFRILEKLPLFALTAAACLVTMVAQKAAMSPLDREPFAERLTNVLIAYAAYLGEMMWPSKLAVLYPLPHGLFWAEAGRAAVVLAVITGLVLLARRRRYLTVGWLWFLGTLVPVIGLVQVGAQSMADRYTYIPSIGLFLALVWGAADLAALRPLPVRAALAPAALLLGIWAPLGLWVLTGNGTEMLWDGLLYRFLIGLTIFTVLAWAVGRLVGWVPARVPALVPALALVLGGWVALAGWQTRLWLTPIWLWEYTVAVTPDNYIAQNALGNAYWNSRHPDRVELARDHFQKSLALAPQHSRAHNNLALILIRDGQLDKAAEHLAAAWAVDHTLAAIPLNWGDVLVLQGRPEEAIDKYRDALAIDPYLSGAHAHLGQALAFLGRWSEAEASFRTALGLSPKRLDTRADLAWALDHQSRREEADAEYARVVEADPLWAENARKTAWSYATNPVAGGRSAAEAVRLAEEACRAAGACDAQYLDTLAAAYAETGALDAAVCAARRALQLACDDEGFRAEVWRRLLGYLARQPYRQAM